LEILDSQVNIFILGAILLLAIIDIIFKKNLKSQIVSLGVLGTFIGIFIGLQDFNPEDMRNSINSILFGLKTAFFTSIVGMGTALVLSTIQKIFSKKIDNSTQESLLLEISKKLDKLEKIESSNDTDRVVFELKQLQKVQINTQNETVKIYNEIQKSSKSEKILLEIYKKLDSTQDTDKIIKELQQLRMVQTDTRDKSVKIYRSIDELRANSNRENQKLIEILDSNFSKMNNSLEIAIDKLSKGATEEIIKALEHVIKEFNNELQNSFGDNFIQLNEAVVNLLEWQSNYKIHIEHIEKHLNISSSSIEKSKESLEVISSKNEAIIDVYKQLKNIINIYYHQIKELNQHLETYSNLSDNAENMFLNITKNISKTTEEFKNLTDEISSSNQEQKESFLSDNKEIKKAHSDLTKHIKSESIKQIEFNKELFTKNKAELDNISKHFNNLGEQIPKALQISLNELNRGLTSLTKEFQKSYKEIMDKYKDGIDNAGR
jgi:acyl carrier protein phosphodiesterase